jgi:hypothetical protein
MSLVTVAKLKEYLPEIGAATGADTELTALLKSVQAFIARYLGYPSPNATPDLYTLDKATYVLYLDGALKTDPLVLQLPIKPIVTLTSVYSDPDRKYDSSSLLDKNNIEIDKVNGRLIIKPTTSTSFDRGYRAIKVTLDAGYDTTSPPTDLVHAICVWTSQLHRAKQTQGKESITQGGQSVRLSMKSMPWEVKEILFRFRCPLLVM